MKFEKYLLKSGEVRWRAYHYFGKNPDTGKREDIDRRGFRSQAEAREALMAIIEKHVTQQEYKNIHKNKYSFGEVTEWWLMHYEKQVKVTTYTNRERLLKVHILPHLKEYYIHRIDVRMCQDLVNTWYATFSEAARLVNLVSQIFKFGINQGFCSDNPMDKIIRPRNTHKQSYKAPFYDKEELLRFLSILKEDESLKAYVMFYTLGFTGLRRGELLGLQWRDLDFQAKTLSVHRNLIYNEQAKHFELSALKTKSSQRIIGIDDNLVTLLKHWQHEQRVFFLAQGMNVHSPEQLVFTSNTNHYIADAYLRRIIKRVTTNHQLPHITVHGFRHTHCSLLFEAGIEIHSVKDRLGHSDIQTTMNIYTHVTKKERDKTAELFNEFMDFNF